MTTFQPNWKYKLEINTSPSGTASYAEVAEGILTMEPEPNEEIAQDNYYADKGNASSEVVGMQVVISLSGHRVFGDAAQDYIAGLQYKVGEDRHTDVRLTFPNGDTIACDVTVANIVAALGPNGDANAKTDFSCELHFNGVPTYTAA